MTKKGDMVVDFYEGEVHKNSLMS